MPGRTNNRNEREIATDRPEPRPATGAGSGRSAAPSGSSRGPKQAPVATETPLTGVVGDASAAGTRTGEDARRRGWFWHWNNIVTQYAPMIGLKGVGLINSYTVWTDRRESSPHRGYAFPSQQSEADFYGEDRAELIAINKILVTLDLIEIRKEMVPRTDDKGRRWKVPHNFYRVKDHDDGFTLTSRDVLRIAELADKDRAVYRYLRRMFSPKFSPIDSQNVWHGILDEVRETDVWRRLADRTAKDESKASARSKAGHAARRANEPGGVFSVPERGDNRESGATATDSDNDSATGANRQPVQASQTSVAKTNTGLETFDEGSNTGSGENQATSVDRSNTAGETNVHWTNSTYYQSLTSTTTEDRDVISVADSGDPDGRPGQFPDDSRAETHGTKRFEEANNRISTPAERRLLRQLAAQFDPVAVQSGQSGWAWLAFAIDDAVAAGSTFVAPRRVREIMTRWGRDGVPEEYAGHVSNRAAPSPAASEPVTQAGRASHRLDGGGEYPERSETIDAGRHKAGPYGAGSFVGEEPFVAPVFTVEACGMSNRQIWSAVLGDLQFSGAVARTEVESWLRDSAVIGVGDDGGLVIGVPHELARRRATGRYLGAIRQAVQRVTGLSLAIDVVLFRDWTAA